MRRISGWIVPVVSLAVVAAFFAAAYVERHSGPVPPSAPTPVAARFPISADVSGGDPISISSEPGTRFRDCDVCPEMIVLPGGTFLIGSPNSERGRSRSEGPQRELSVSAFAVGRFEVTFAEWAACATNGPCPSKPGPHDLPVTGVSWDEAQGYVSWLSTVSSRSYRLPSEAEWEYAARGGTMTPFWTGDWIFDSQAAFGLDAVRRVGSYSPNPFGLHDTAGNVWEYVQDCWNFGFTNVPADGAAARTGDCETRVKRGGAWDAYWRTNRGRSWNAYSYSRDDRGEGNSRTLLRSASRTRTTPTVGTANTGVRVA